MYARWAEVCTMNLALGTVSRQSDRSTDGSTQSLSVEAERRVRAIFLAASQCSVDQSIRCTPTRRWYERFAALARREVR